VRASRLERDWIERAGPPDVLPMQAGVMWLDERGYFTGVLPLDQFLENCALGAEWDPEEAAGFPRHPRSCRHAMESMAERVVSLAREECPEAKSRAIGLAMWCVLNHPETGAEMRSLVSSVLRGYDRVAVTLTGVGGRLAASVGTAYAPPSTPVPQSPRSGSRPPAH
jgi:hypothetical protein